MELRKLLYREFLKPYRREFFHSIILPVPSGAPHLAALQSLNSSTNNTISSMSVITDHLVTIFSLEKVQNDLFQYLEEVYPDSKIEKDSFMVEVENIEFPDDFSPYRIVNITREDLITLTMYGCRHIPYRNDTYYTIIIGIGDFTPNDKIDDFFTVSKCLAKLHYNYDFSLYEIEFYTTPYNCPEKIFKSKKS